LTLRVLKVCYHPDAPDVARIAQPNIVSQGRCNILVISYEFVSQEDTASFASNRVQTECMLIVVRTIL